VDGFREITPKDAKQPGSNPRTLQEASLKRGREEIKEYFGGVCWNTARKKLRKINDVTILWYSASNKPHLDEIAYEKKFGSPIKDSPTIYASV
jgi:hypothetical protein